MKILLTSLVTVALTAGLVGSADAGSYRKKKRAARGALQQNL